MPIRVSTPIKIRRPRAVTAAPVATSLTAPILNVRLIRQQTNQWCWAACTEMVAKFLGVQGVSQCQLANFLHNRTNCCQAPTSNACNQPSPYEGIGKVYLHIGVNCISHTWAVNHQVILRELQNERPVEVGYLWFGGGGHVAIIYGITPQGLYAVHDPWFGSGLCTYLHLWSGYGQGKWAFSFGDFRILT
jgi:hypothetical protein